MQSIRWLLCEVGRQMSLQIMNNYSLMFWMAMAIVLSTFFAYGLYKIKSDTIHMLKCQPHECTPFCSLAKAHAPTKRPAIRSDPDNQISLSSLALSYVVRVSVWQNSPFKRPSLARLCSIEIYYRFVAPSEKDMVLFSVRNDTTRMHTTRTCSSCGFSSNDRASSPYVRRWRWA